MTGSAGIVVCERAGTTLASVVNVTSPLNPVNLTNLVTLMNPMDLVLMPFAPALHFTPDTARAVDLE
jgi:hypothetical protein